MAWGEDRNGVRVYDLHAGQTDILCHPARFKAAVAGTGGGKTVLGPLWVGKQISRVIASRDITREPVSGMILAPTHDVMFRATAPTLVSMLAGTDFHGRYVESKRRYYLHSDMGTIWMLSADRPEGIEGGQFDFVWIDEGGQIGYDAWVAVQGRTGKKQAPVLITTTPYGHNWLFSKFFKLAQQGNPNYYVRQWSSIENPSYPREEYERAKAEMSPQRFAMRYDGNFVKLAGLVYPDLASCVEPFTTVPEGYLYGGIDWGWNPDPFACLVACVDEADHMWVFRERYIRGTRIGDHAKSIPLNVEYYADSSRPDLIAELIAADHVVRGNRVKALDVGFEAVNRRIYNGTLHIAPCCRALIGESREYRYPEKDDEIVAAEPVGANHALDALRYLIANVDRHRIAERRQDREPVAA